jgi:pilus assembly protein Flp/PilA
LRVRASIAEWHPKLERVQLVRNLLRSFVVNERGATAIEYGLIAAGISIAIIATVAGLGTNLNSTFSSVSTQLK